MAIAEDHWSDLVRLTRLNDAKAYKELLQECLPMIRQAARFYLNRFGQLSYAEDIVQETLLAVHQKLHTYDVDQPFLPWLKIVTRHKAIDFLRRQRVKTTSIDDHESSLELVEPVCATEDAMAKRDLSNLLNRLKPPAGEIIHALKIEGASISDLAAKFGMSESNIKVTVHRGLNKLSKLVMNEQGIQL